MICAYHFFFKSFVLAHTRTIWLLAREPQRDVGADCIFIILRYHSAYAAGATAEAYERVRKEECVYVCAVFLGFNFTLLFWPKTHMYAHVGTCACVYVKEYVVHIRATNCAGKRETTVLADRLVGGGVQ